MKKRAVLFLSFILFLLSACQPAILAEPTATTAPPPTLEPTAIPTPEPVDEPAPIMSADRRGRVHALVGRERIRIHPPHCGTFGGVQASQGALLSVTTICPALYTLLPMQLTAVCNISAISAVLEIRPNHESSFRLILIFLSVS